ncbi:hypothetical protein ACFVJ4_43245 [Streptomyces sp. NPDC127178]|uniref:hypothetical protein n=1 Tax=unclassified Streptomyces TaxID=2593676 RepID=UPI00363822BC
MGCLLTGEPAGCAARVSRTDVPGSQLRNGKLGFTVRALRSSFTYDAGRLADSPGVRRNVVQRRDGTEERSYGANVGGPGSGEQGCDAVEFKQMVDAAGGDVTAAVSKLGGLHQPDRGRRDLCHLRRPTCSPKFGMP